MNLNVLTIPADFTHAYMSVFKNAGYSDDILQVIWDGELEKIMDRNAMMSTADLLRVVDRGYRFGNIPHVGLVMGNQLNLTAHGMAGIAAMTQSVYIDALRIASRVCDAMFPALHLEVVEGEQDVRLVLTETTPLKPYSHFFAEVVFVSFYNILHYLLGEGEEPLRIKFAYAEPAHGNVYRRYFRCPLKFGAKQSAIVLSRQTASRPLALANKNMAQFAENQIFSAPQTVTTALQQQLRKILRQRYSGDFPSLEKMAHMLGTSGRTLRRQLKLDGTSYQNELDEVRKEIAINHLASSDISITDIANMLGFNDSAAFSRAFKKWTDLSPSQYRLQLAGKELPIVDAN